MIHVCFGLYDKTGRYSKFTGTAMLSLFENINTPPPSTTIHILHDNTLTNDNREKFSYLAGRYNQLVKFYNVEELCAEKISKFVELTPEIKNAQVSVGTLYRLLIPQILPSNIDKIIYLDSDIIVNLDVKELWQIELGEKILAAVPEIFYYKSPDEMNNGFRLCKDGFVRHEDYFNAGVLVMNLNLLCAEESAIIDGFYFTQKYRQCSYFDQDVLNYCFSTKTLKLPLKFNRFIDFARIHHETRIEKKIYHYVGQHLQLNMNDPFNRLWMKYFVKTPWFDEKTIEHLYTSVQGLHVGLKIFAAQVSAIMSGKTRAFFTFPHNVEAIKKIFSIRDDEKIILAENQESLQKLIDAMKLSAGKKVFFILAPFFPFQALIQEGFVPNKDFVNGMDFLSEAQGLPLNSYPMIQAM